MNFNLKCSNFIQGAREEGPADDERADADAQVITSQLSLYVFSVSLMLKWRNECKCMFLLLFLNFTGTC